jgi:2-dehydro-3-deoxygalactonokinase
MNPMDSSVTIFGDWGTSRLRLYLRQGKSVLDRRDGPGIGSLNGASPREVFLRLVGDWREAGPSMALLCGMVGSRNGWQEAAYAPCPAGAADIRERLLHIDADGLPVAIVPGLSCRNALGGPDVMRGEETQILGALELDPALKRGRHLLALPGTHTKWVAVEDGRIAHFVTAPVGELYALLREHSILAKAAPGDDPESPEGFAQGVARDRRARRRAPAAPDLRDPQPPTDRRPAQGRRHGLPVGPAAGRRRGRHRRLVRGPGPGVADWRAGP